MNEKKSPKYIQMIFNQVIHLYMSRGMELMSEINMNPGQGGMLWTLSGQDGISQKELARKIRVTPPSLTVMIKKMESKGLIIRKPDENDQRVIRIYITEEGKKLSDKTKEVIETLESEIFQGMTEEEQLLFRRLLMQMRDNLSRDGKGETGMRFFSHAHSHCSSEHRHTKRND